MKQLFTSFLAMFLFSGILHAQINAKKTAPQQLLHNNDQVMHALLAGQQAWPNAAKGSLSRTTDIAERLIATSSYQLEDNVGITDSEYYTYSGSRSSVFNFNNMSYETTFEALNPLNPIGIIGRDVAFDHNDLPGVLFDSCIYAISISNVKEYAVYDANNNITQLFTTSVAEQLINTYDANQNITSCISLNMGSGTPDSAQMRRFFYNGNKIASDTNSGYINGSWSASSSWAYSYDNAGNIIQATLYHYYGSWYAERQYFFSYNPDNRVQKDSIVFYENGVWYPYTKDSVGYTSGINYATYERLTSYNDETTAVDNYIEYIKHITSGLPDTMYYNQYNAVGQILNAVKTSYLYDSYGNPITSFQYQFHDVSGNNGYYSTTPEYAGHYYYQVFNTAVNDLVRQPVKISFYPNPANDIVYISQTGIGQRENILFTVINVSGQVVTSKKVASMGNAETISVAGLVPGCYWIVAQDKTGNILSKQIIVKQ